MCKGMCTLSMGGNLSTLKCRAEVWVGCQCNIVIVISTDAQSAIELVKKSPSMLSVQCTNQKSTKMYPCYNSDVHVCWAVTNGMVPIPRDNFCYVCTYSLQGVRELPATLSKKLSRHCMTQYSPSFLR